MKGLIALIVYSVVIYISPNFIDGVEIGTFNDALIASLLLGIVNATLGFLLKIFFHLFTMGLFFVLGLGFVIRFFVGMICLRVVDVWMVTFSIREDSLSILSMAFIISLSGFFLDILLNKDR